MSVALVREFLRKKIMYREEIKQLLEKVYGPPKHSLVLDEKTKPETEETSNSAGKTYYYYTFPDADRVRSMRDALAAGLEAGGGKWIADLTQEYPKRARGDISESSIPQCACYYEGKYGWHLTFYEIKGVQYHKSRGKQIAAKLILKDQGAAYLYEDEPGDFFGYWDDLNHRGGRKGQKIEGMYYWMNKNLALDPMFRRFSEEFFLVRGEKSGYGILKDIGRTIGKFGFFLPPMMYKELVQFHTPGEFIRSLLPTADKLGINLDALDLNTAYVIARLAPVIRPIDWKYLKALPEEVVRKAFSLNGIFEGVKTEDIVAAYYQVKLDDGFSWCREVVDTARDYAHMCLECNVPIGLRYSEGGLERAHDEMVQRMEARTLEDELNTPLVTVPSRFDRLEEGLCTLYPQEFERIRDARRLLEEGQNQHNCVFTRRGIVREDHAAIFHWHFADDDYTIQFERNYRGDYVVAEIRGKYNEDCPAPVLKELRDTLNMLSIMSWE